MATKKIWIPAALTLAGVGCGFAALILLLQGRYVAGMLWMFLAVFFDGIDGKVASMLNAKSEFGAVLDSKADVVSFAVVPGVAAYLFFHRSPDHGMLVEIAAWTTGIGYTCAGIFREVRFMVSQTDRTRSEGFIGLPIVPPAGLIVAMLALANLFPNTLYRPAGQVAVFLVVVLNAYLMTGSTINYLRWGGRAIALQNLVALAAGIAGYFALGSIGGFFAVYFITFCAIYISFHPALTLLRSAGRARSAA
jgi:CDP-diacylglycerol--serine O-phosphatidyltransferase